MIEQLLSWLKLPRHVAWSLVVVSGLLLWGPDTFKTGLGLQPFIDDYRKWIGIVFLFFLVVGLQPLVPFLAKKVIDRYSKKKQEKESKQIEQEKKREAEEKLNKLTPGEKEILRYYIQYNTRSQDLNIQNGEVSKLLSDGFIYLASNVSYGGMRGSFTFPVNISDWVWEYVRENPEVLD